MGSKLHSTKVVILWLTIANFVFYLGALVVSISHLLLNHSLADIKTFGTDAVHQGIVLLASLGTFSVPII